MSKPEAGTSVGSPLYGPGVTLNDYVTTAIPAVYVIG